MGATNSNKQIHRILAFLPSLRIRSRTTFRLDLDVTKDKTIRQRRSRTHPKIRTRQHRRSQSKCYPAISKIPPRTKAPLQQEYPVSIITSRRPSTKKNTKNQRTPQTTQSMGRSFYCLKSHWTRHVQVNNWRWERSQQYMAHQPTKKILRMKTTQGRIHVQTTRDQRSRPIKMVFLDKICIMAYQTIMINKDGFLATYVVWRLIPSCSQKAKWLKIRLSIPAESKIAEKTLEPADEGS